MLNPENSGNQGFWGCPEEIRCMFSRRECAIICDPINSVKLVKTNIPPFTKSQIPLKLNRFISKIMSVIRGLLLYSFQDK